MEVRNNTPSFGMAFIKPKAEDISGFTKHVIKGRRPILVARGLTQVQKAHACDKYVDIHYLPDAKGFSVIPKSDSEVSKSIIEKVLGGTSKPFYSSTVNNPTRMQAVIAEGDAEFSKLEKAGASNLRKTAALVKHLCRISKECIRTIISPKEILPPDLRAASAEAKRVEKVVADELAKYAAKEQRRIANEKLIDKALM